MCHFTKNKAEFVGDVEGKIDRFGVSERQLAWLHRSGYEVCRVSPSMPKEPIPARAAAYVALYPMLLQIAKDHGYALAVHGSIHRDLDLVAVPWIESASDGLTLIKAFKKATRTVVHHETTDRLLKDCKPTQKPHGRIGYALHVTNKGMYGGYLDISVMPRQRKKRNPST